MTDTSGATAVDHHDGGDDHDKPPQGTATTLPGDVPPPPAGEPIVVPAHATGTIDQWALADPEVAAKADAFRTMFNSGADQKMDRGTLDLRMKTLDEATAAAAAASPTPPATDPPATPPADTPPATPSA